MFNDFDVFWRAAQAVLQGHDPYALEGVFYPLPFFFLFVPLAALPLEWAHILWTAIELLIVVAILRRRALSVLLFVPTYLSLLMGQVVIPMLGLFSLLRTGRFGGIALGLLALKPQLIVVMAPWLMWRWWQKDRRQIIWFFFVLVMPILLALLIQPDWIERWLSVSGGRLRAAISPSFWGLFSFLPAPWWIACAALLSGAVVVWSWRQSDLDMITAAGMLANPVLISYDLMLLTVMVRDTRFWLVLTGLSWVAFALSAWQLNERWYVAISLAVLIALWRKHRDLVRGAHTGVAGSVPQMALADSDSPT